MYEMTLVRVAVLQGLASVNEVLGMAELSALCCKVQSVDTVENFQGYAFHAGRNAGIDKGRQRCREARRLAQLEVAQQAQQVRMTFEHDCQTELWMLCDAPPPSAQWVRWGEMMAIIRFGLSGATVAYTCEHFDVSANVVYQWRRRALMALRPKMSVELLSWLEEHGREFGVGYKSE